MCRTLVSALFHIRLLSLCFCLASGPFAFSFVSTMRLIFVSYLLNVFDRCAGGSCDLEGAVLRLSAELQYSPFQCPQKTFLSCCASDIRACPWAWGRPKLSSANGIKNLNWFCIARCEIMVIGFGNTPLWSHSKSQFCEYLNNQCFNKESDKLR